VLIRFQNRRFQPTLFGTLLTLAGVVGGILLGRWQLHRADEKQVLLDQFARGQLQTLAYQAGDAGKPARYQHVAVEGVYDGEHQVLLDNMPSAAGRAGFRVLTPLKISENPGAGDRWLLVDRGWVPLGSTRADLPDVHVDPQAGSVRGRLDDLPQPGMRLGENPQAPADAPWPRVLSFPRHAELEQLLGHPVEPWILLLDAAEPQGYERAWGADFGIGPPRHIAYAVQWFAMAFAMVCVYLVVSFKHHNEAVDGRPHDAE
jgi:surfeit locus 1 family protein